MIGGTLPLPYCSHYWCRYSCKEKIVHAQRTSFSGSPFWENYINNSKKTNFELRNKRVWFGSLAASPPGLKVVSFVAAGANGSVFKALDTKLGRFVALKLWHPGVVRKQANRPLMESRKNASLEHQRLVAVYEFNDEATIPYMTMQFVDGVSAKNWLTEKCSVAARRQLWSQYVEAMDFVYRNGKIHGDPHTGNVLLQHKQDDLFDVKLTDMGASALRQSREKFEQRECTILCETCERVMPEGSPVSLLQVRAFEMPHMALKALDTAVRVVVTLKYLEDQLSKVHDDEFNWDYDIRKHIYDIFFITFDVPLFDFEVLFNRLRALHLPDQYLSLLLAQVDSAPKNYEEMKSFETKSPHPGLDMFTQVQKKYCERSDFWLKTNATGSDPLNNIDQ